MMCRSTSCILGLQFRATPLGLSFCPPLPDALAPQARHDAGEILNEILLAVLGQEDDFHDAPLRGEQFLDGVESEPRQPVKSRDSR
jgi:hypothetical protein